MRETYVHFPATPREVEEKRHLQFPEGFQVLTKPFSRELLQSVLVALGSLLYFTFLVGGQDGKTQSWSAEQLSESGSTPFLLSLPLLLRVSPPKYHLESRFGTEGETEGRKGLGPSFPKWIPKGLTSLISKELFLDLISLQHISFPSPKNAKVLTTPKVWLVWNSFLG